MAGVTAEQPLPLIGEIYDAATDPARWSAVLGGIAGHVGGRSAVLFTKDSAGRHFDLHHESGLDPVFRQHYLEKHFRLDPMIAGPCIAEIGRAVGASELLPYEALADTPFWRQWAQPQGIVDLVFGVLDRAGSRTLVLVVLRGSADGPVDDAARARLALLLPHIRRAWMVGRLIDFKTSAAATFTETLDGLRTGICLVDADGRIVHANHAGRAILVEGDFLSAAGERILARDARVDRSLRELFAGAASDTGPQGTALPLRAADGSHYVVHVLPLATDAQRLASAAHAATVALFIRKAAIDSPAAPEVIARAYNLTPTELRVLLAIVEVGGVPEVALTLGVAETTVKTHLGRLFEKTGVGRQADLVKIVAGFSTPLAD